jgi:fatty acid desaturase
MIDLTALWLPILLSAVIVFFASFIMHMVLAYHKSDYRKLPDEDRVTDALRNAGVTRGPLISFRIFRSRR